MVTFDERAREHLDQIWRRRTEMSIEEFNAEATAANANALLALKLPLEDMAEQLRIANLIALTNTRNINQLRDAGIEGLIASNGLISPDIATALGVGR